MTDEIIDTEAHTLREVHEINGRGIGAICNDKVMDDLVDLIEAHTHLGVVHGMFKGAGR